MRAHTKATVGWLFLGIVIGAVLAVAAPRLFQEDDPMTRRGFLFQVKVERLEEYKRIHREVWPEMLAALSRHGWRNYSLFMRENDQVFGYFEVADSIEASQRGMAREEINARWQEMMAPFFEDLSDDEGRSVVLEEVFHLD